MNYYEHTRTNYVKTTDLKEFARLGGLLHADVVKDETDDRVALLFTDGEGIGSYIIDENGEEVEFSFIDAFAPLLADGEVMIVMGAGHEGLRYICGWAQAFNNKGEVRSVNIYDIYALASDMGTTVTQAEY